ncbi:MAG: hydantoinase/oxoprolinase family protein [Aggregatilineales bacterium]
MTGLLRIGVDVGGTFTKAVAVQPSPFEIVAQAIVPTTHGSAEGVARGVVEALAMLLQHPAVSGQPIAVVSHSTTQAVNALLEGDVVKVGIVGIGPAADAAQLRKLTTPDDIPLAPGHVLPTVFAWLDSPVTPEMAEQSVRCLIEQGAGAIVASGAYSVDDPADEQQILDTAAAHHIPAVGGHEVSSVYGLEIRTMTAAINASILPKMTQTADQVEACLRIEHIDAPLLIMRGDGGLTDSAGLRHRPILSLLSGPAASVAGALLSGRVLDGIFIEVGGTSTNLAVIRDGQPALRYVQIMDRPTAIRSLDVRVQGVAGGSLARLRGRKITDVGPRSAHIAGLPYLSFSNPHGELRVELIAPRPGDPADYVVVCDADSTRFALTVTCAANALGLVPGGAYAAAQQETALRGFAALGTMLGVSPEKAAARVMELASKPIADAVQRLAREYKLRHIELIGGGGGCGALVPAVAERLHVPYRLAEHAEVISSIGVALALVREEVERGTANTTPDLVAREAVERAVAAGAAPDSVQVVTELVPERAMIRAIASGALALDGHNPSVSRVQELSADELRLIAARRADSETDQVESVGVTGRFHVFRVNPKRGLFRRGWTGIIAVDAGGAIRLTAQNATALCGSSVEAINFVRERARGTTLPHVTIIAGNRLIRLPETNDSAALITTAESALQNAESPVIVITEPVAWL